MARRKRGRETGQMPTSSHKFFVKANRGGGRRGRRGKR